MAEITSSGFAQLDLVIVPQDCLWRVRQIRSDRHPAFSSHHFLVECLMEVKIDKITAKNNLPRRLSRLNLGSLKDAAVQSEFCKCFDAHVASASRAPVDSES